MATLTATDPRRHDPERRAPTRRLCLCSRSQRYPHDHGACEAYRPFPPLPSGRQRLLHSTRAASTCAVAKGGIDTRRNPSNRVLHALSTCRTGTSGKRSDDPLLRQAFAEAHSLPGPCSDSSAPLEPEKRSSSVAAVAPGRTRNRRVIVIASLFAFNDRTAKRRSRSKSRKRGAGAGRP